MGSVGFYDADDGTWVSVECGSSVSGSQRMQVCYLTPSHKQTVTFV